MVSKSHLRHQLADHKNWFPAIHHDELTHTEKVKHCFEYAFPERCRAADIEGALSSMEEIAQDYDPKKRLRWLTYSQKEVEGSPKESHYLLVFTEHGDILNKLEKERLPTHSERYYSKFSKIDRNTSATLKKENGGSGTRYIFGNASVRREGPRLFEQVAGSIALR